MGLLHSENAQLLFLGQIHFTGRLRCLTGLHIGGSGDALKIGGIDRSVIKHPLTDAPYVPGSSLKGRMRALLERTLRNPDRTPLKANRRGGGENVYRHEHDDANEDVDKGTSSAMQCPLCRLMGATSTSGEQLNLPARLTVRDLDVDGDYTLEIKTENALDRLTAFSNPRTNERVSAGTRFVLDATYDVVTAVGGDGADLAPLLGTEAPNTFDEFWAMVTDDVHHVLDGFRLVELDALGGNGSRGYGRVFFDTVTVQSQTTSALTTADPADAVSVTEARTPGGDALGFPTLRGAVDDVLAPLREGVPAPTS